MQFYDVILIFNDDIQFGVLKWFKSKIYLHTNAKSIIFYYLKRKNCKYSLFYIFQFIFATPYEDKLGYLCCLYFNELPALSIRRLDV